MRFNRRDVTSLIRKMIIVLLNIKKKVDLFSSGSGNTNKGADPGDEPQLHGVQIPTDQSTPLDKGMFISQQVLQLKRQDVNLQHPNRARVMFVYLAFKSAY